MSKNNHLNKSSANRNAKKKAEKKEKKLLKFIVFSAAILALFLAVLNYRSIMAPFEDIGQRLIRSSDAGFPVRLPGSASYSISPFDNGFKLLTETYVYTYAADGGFNYAYQHAYSSPKAAVNDRRILVYDENGRKFAFLNRSGLAFEHESEERILYGAIGNTNDRIAIVYRDAVYANVLEIYDSKGDWKYRKRFADENIMQIDFAAFDNEIIVTSIGFDGNTWGSTASVRRIDTTTDSDALWVTSLPEGTQPYAIRTVGDNIFVLCDDAFYAINFNDGAVKGRFTYTGKLIDFAFSDDPYISCAILVNDFSAGTVNLITADDFADVIAVYPVSSGASQVEIHNESVFVLEPTAIKQYNAYEARSPESIPLNEEFSRFIHVGNEILLLGYNTVERASDFDENEQ